MHNNDKDFMMCDFNNNNKQNNKLERKLICDDTLDKKNIQFCLLYLMCIVLNHFVDTNKKRTATMNTRNYISIC